MTDRPTLAHVPARPPLAPRDLSGLTPDQVDDYAATLHRAAMRARAILNGVGR